MLVLADGLNLALDILVTTIHATAICFTVLRLRYRKRTHRLWWDDFTVFCAVILDCGYVATLWLSYGAPGSRLRTEAALIIKYWVTLILFFVVIWLTRISIALAIARVFPPGEPTRRFVTGITVLFIGFFICIEAYFVIFCSKKNAVFAPGGSRNAQCGWSNELKITISIANLLSDSLLVATPLYKLWRVNLPKRQKRLILGGFASSIMTTIPTIGCVVFQFAPASWEPARQDIRVKLSFFESGNSIMACNLLVIVTYFDNVRRRRAESQTLNASTASEMSEAQRTASSNRYTDEGPLSTLVLTEISETSVYNPDDRISVESPISSSPLDRHKVVP